MTNTYFQELMKEFGCYANHNTAFGTTGVFPFTAKLHGQQSASIISVRFLLTGKTNECLAYLKEHSAEYLSWGLENHTEGDSAFTTLTCLVEPSTDFYIKALLHTLFHDAVKVFPQFELTAPQTCPLCGFKSPDAYVYWEGDYRAAHASCVKTKLTLPEEDIVISGKVKGNYLTGILGAFIGAFIAVIPNMANALSNGRITTPLYIVIPFLSFLMYRLFRGKASRNFSTLSVFFASLSTAFFLELFWFWITLSAHTGETVSFWASNAYYFSTHNLPMTVREMFFGLLFFGGGLIPTNILIRRYADNSTTPSKRVRGAKFIRESLHPFSDFASKEKDTK